VSEKEDGDEERRALRGRRLEVEERESR